MRCKSVAITAVAAVIIVTRLLFACWYMQHDDEDGVKVGEGYTQVFEETSYDSDGTVLGSIVISQTMVGLDGDVMTYQGITSDGDLVNYYDPMTGTTATCTAAEPPRGAASTS